MDAASFDDVLPVVDSSAFFKDEVFRARYPDLKMPPPSFISSGAKIVTFESGKSIALAFPVRGDQMNPIGTTPRRDHCTRAITTLIRISANKASKTTGISAMQCHWIP